MKDTLMNIFIIGVFTLISYIIKLILKKPYIETLKIVEKNLGKYILTILCILIVTSVIWVEKGDEFINWVNNFFR